MEFVNIFFMIFGIRFSMKLFVLAQHYFIILMLSIMPIILFITLPDSYSFSLSVLAAI